jgi:lysyl-tRNA synthetase class II
MAPGLIKKAYTMTKEKEHALAHEEQHSSQEHLIRVEKVKKLRELGIEPWPESKAVTATTKDVVEQFEDGQEKGYTIAVF